MYKIFRPLSFTFITTSFFIVFVGSYGHSDVNCMPAPAHSLYQTGQPEFHDGSVERELVAIGPLTPLAFTIAANLNSNRSLGLTLLPY